MLRETKEIRQRGEAGSNSRGHPGAAGGLPIEPLAGAAVTSGIVGEAANAPRSAREPRHNVARIARLHRERRRAGGHGGWRITLW